MKIYKKIVNRIINFHFPFYWMEVSAFCFIYLYTLVKGGFEYWWVNDLWQSLGIKALQEFPINSLLNNHIQPPGLNLIFAIALQFPNWKLLLQIFYFVISISTIIFISKSVYIVTNSSLCSRIIGILYATFPTTVLYALFPYNQNLVAFGFSLAIFGLVQLNKQKYSSAMYWNTGIIIIFLIRPTMSSWLAIFLLLFPLLYKKRESARNFIAMTLISVMFVLSVQSYYIFKFGLFSTSSMTSLNYLDSVVNSNVISENELRKAAGSDVCFSSIAKEIASGKRATVLWGDVLPELDSSCFVDTNRFSSNIYLFEGPKISEDTRNAWGQFNTRERLALSKKLIGLDARLVLQNPLASLQMAIGANGNKSTFEYLLSPGYQFFFLANNLWAGAPLNMLTRPLNALFPGAALSLSLLLTLISFRVRKNFSEIIISNFIIFVWVGISTLTTLGENSRHLVEIYPLLIVNFAFFWETLKKLIRDVEKN